MVHMLQDIWCIFIQLVMALNRPRNILKWCVQQEFQAGVDHKKGIKHYFYHFVKKSQLNQIVFQIESITNKNYAWMKQKLCHSKFLFFFGYVSQ